MSHCFCQVMVVETCRHFKLTYDANHFLRGSKVNFISKLLFQYIKLINSGVKYFWGKPVIHKIVLS